MKLTQILFAIFVLGICAMAQQSKSQQLKPSTKKTPLDWQQIHRSAIVIDTHADTPGRFVDENFDPSSDAGPTGHWDLAKARAGNLGAEFFSIWVDPEKFSTHPSRRALDMIDSVYETVRQHPNEMVMAFSVKDIEAARRGPNPKVAALMGVEGAHAMEGDIRILRDFYRLGVRYMTLTWMNSNELGQSSGDLPKPDPQTGKVKDPGLTQFGRDMVKEMNRLGMMVDISHVSDRSFYNALTVSRAPVIASHSSARAVANHPRNMTDDMLEALARNGGVAQVNFNCGFISNDYIAASKAFEAAHPEEMRKARELWLGPKTPENKAELANLMTAYRAAVPRPPLSALIDHIDHMAKVAGIDHVGLGSDFDGVECLPEGIDSVADLPKITQELVKRGYNAQDIHKILGGNLLRVFAEVEKTAKEIQNEKNSDTRQEVKLPPPDKK
ncbi:MAG TPA: dipeptidase [Candidatus Acidoferrales bacterium]|nr:dipeptidase [Candidatus Acidoferrales bacterium]